MADPKPEPENACPSSFKCGNPATEPHTCPFAEEINDDETLCRCCDGCQHECAMDI